LNRAARTFVRAVFVFRTRPVAAAIPGCRRAGHPAWRINLTHVPNRPDIYGSLINRAFFPGGKSELQLGLTASREIRTGKRTGRFAAADDALYGSQDGRRYAATVAPRPLDRQKKS